MASKISSPSARTFSADAHLWLLNAIKSENMGDPGPQLDLLISQGVNVDLEPAGSFRPISLAARFNRPDWILALAGRGASLNCLGSKMTHPLFEAITHNCTDAAIALVELGAHVKKLDIEGSSFALSCFRGNPNIRHISALHVAAKFGNVDLIDPIIKAGSRIDFIDSSGNSVLGGALLVERMIRALVSRGADVEAADARGDRLIHKVIRSDYRTDLENAGLFAYVLSLDVDLKTPNNIGDTPLQMVKANSLLSPILASHLARQAALEALGELSACVKRMPAGVRA